VQQKRTEHLFIVRLWREANAGIVVLVFWPERLPVNLLDRTQISFAKSANRERIDIPQHPVLWGRLFRERRDLEVSQRPHPDDDAHRLHRSVRGRDKQSAEV